MVEYVLVLIFDKHKVYWTGNKELFYLSDALGWLFNVSNMMGSEQLDIFYGGPKAPLVFLIKIYKILFLTHLNIISDSL